MPFAPAQLQYIDWATRNRQKALARKPFRDRWCKRHGFTVQPLPPPAENDDDQGDDENNDTPPEP